MVCGVKEVSVAVFQMPVRIKRIRNLTKYSCSCSNSISELPQYVSSYPYNTTSYEVVLMKQLSAETMQNKRNRHDDP